MITEISAKNDRENCRKLAWQQLNELADNAEETSKLGDTIHQDLIQKMIIFIRRQDIDALKQLANNGPIFFYTANIRRVLEKIL